MYIALTLKGCQVNGLIISNITVTKYELQLISEAIHQSKNWKYMVVKNETTHTIKLRVQQSL